MTLGRATATAAVLAAWLALPAPAHADSAPDAGLAFTPRPASQPLYAMKAPAEDPQRQKHVVEGGDGTDLYVETWLPAPKGPNTPPERVPVILIMTPYVQEDQQRYTTRNLANVAEWFTARGYAVAQHHVRGTGNSGGCLEQTAANQIDDGARVVEFLGRDAPYASGAVGMYGHSYDAETQVSVAGRGDPKRTQYLKAIVPSASVGGQYEYSFMDGVPYTGQALLSNTSYLALTSLAPGTAPVDEHTFERFGCQGEVFAGSADQSGDLTPFWQVREYRPGAGSVRAATLWVHGLADWNVMPIAVSAFFDRLPGSTPHKGVFGQWEHNYPDKHAGVQPEWAREDFLAMVTAWYDRYLNGIDTGVEGWPPVQVQDTTGQWRIERGYPWTGGPVGQLALGPDGVLGAGDPAGSTVFEEGPDDEETVEGTRAVFETPALGGPLHITGAPVADLWLTSSANDAHIAAKLQVIGADGAPLAHAGSAAQELGTHGARSLRHLEPMPDGYFTQAEGQPVATDTPVRVPLRLHPVDLVVPAGGRLRLTISGSTSWARETEPSGAASVIELLHGCDAISALRFLMADPNALRLNVRETDEASSPILPSNPVAAGPLADGGGLASAGACGQPPERIPLLGPAAFHGPGDPGPPGAPPAGRGPTGPGICTPAPPSTRVRRLRLNRRGVRASGTATAGCGAAVARVNVRVALVTRRGCRFLSPRGRLGRARRCRPTFAAARRARGTTRWSVVIRARLPRGRYAVWARAVDTRGASERGRRRSGRVR